MTDGYVYITGALRITKKKKKKKTKKKTITTKKIAQQPRQISFSATATSLILNYLKRKNSNDSACGEAKVETHMVTFDF